MSYFLTNPHESEHNFGMFWTWTDRRSWNGHWVCGASHVLLIFVTMLFENLGEESTWYPLVIKRHNWKPPMHGGLNGNIIYEWWIFNCPVWLPNCPVCFPEGGWYHRRSLCSETWNHRQLEEGVKRGLESPVWWFDSVFTLWSLR